MAAFPPVDDRQEQSGRPRAVTHRHHAWLVAGGPVEPAQAGDEHGRIATVVGVVSPHEFTPAHRLVITHPRALQPVPGSPLQPMWRWTFSALDGPASVAAIHGPGIDGSMMPSSSHV